MSEPKWVLEADEKQFAIIMAALDLYSRIIMGQIEEIGNFFRWNNNGHLFRFDHKNHDLIEQAVQQIKWVVFPLLHPNASYGIFSKEVPQESKIAYELIQVIRHRISWDKAGNPEKRDWSQMMTVNFDDPMKCSDHPMPTMKKVD